VSTIFTALCIACNAKRCNSYVNSVRLSVSPSVTRWYRIQMNEDRIMQSSWWGSKNTLVLWHQVWLGGDVPFHLLRIGSRPRAFQWAIDEVRTLPLSPPKGGSKSKFVIFVNKNQFKSNKLCYKVSSCENFQRQSYRRIIPLFNGVYMLAVNVNLERNI